MASASLNLLKAGKAKESAEAKAVPTAADAKSTNDTKATTTVMAVTKTTPKPAPKPAPEPEKAPEPVADDTEATVDVDTLDSDGLDVLVSEHGVDTPPEWESWDAEAKRGWLKSQFEEVGDSEAEEAAAAMAESQPAKKASEKAAEKVAAKKAAAKSAAPAESQAAAESAPEPSKAVAETSAKTKPTGKKAVKAMVGEIMPPDELSDIVHTLENLKEADAKSLITQLQESAEFAFFKLGGVMSIVQKNGWYAPFASFREYIESEHGINYRRAMVWVSIYDDLSQANVPWEKVSHLGWTKLHEIAAILTPDNVDKWVEIAENNTTLQLHEIVANANKSGAPKAIEDQTAKTVTTKTFKMHDDQRKTVEAALEKSKEISGSTVDTVALEHICLEFLGSPQTKSLKDQLIALGSQAALQLVSDAFPDVTIEVSIPEVVE